MWTSYFDKDDGKPKPRPIYDDTKMLARLWPFAAASKPTMALTMSLRGKKAQSERIQASAVNSKLVQ